MMTALPAAPAQKGLFEFHENRIRFLHFVLMVWVFYIVRQIILLKSLIIRFLCRENDFSYSLRMSLSTVLLPAPMPPPMKRSTGLLSLWATGAITSVHWESSFVSPIAFISSTNVLKTLATFRFLVTLSILCSLCTGYYLG